MKRLGLVSLFASLLVACLGTESGNPPAAPKTMGLRSSDPTIASVGPASGVDAVIEAWVSLREVRLVEGAACDHVSPHAVLASIAGDLVTGVDTAGLPAGDVCGLHVAMAPPTTLPPGAPAALEGRSVLVRGTRANGDPFEIASEATPTIGVLTTAPTIALREGTAVLLTFDAARWLASLSLDATPLDADGVARIEPGRGDAALAAFEAGLMGSLELYRDVDGDGVLDAAEEAAGTLAASH